MDCHYSAAGAGKKHRVKTGGRALSLKFHVDWGDQDIRDSHEKPLVFCSFGCLSDWAADRAADHDGNVLKEGD